MSKCVNVGGEGLEHPTNVVGIIERPLTFVTKHAHSLLQDINSVL